MSEAHAFREMADKIDLNSGNGFGGAFVISPPGSEAQTLLVLDNSQNPAIFWSLVKTRADIALAVIADAERQGQNGFGRR